MSAAYLVFYEGRSSDSDAFVRYYLEHHVPIIWTWPGIRNVEVARGVDGGDFALIARFTFDSLDDLRLAINSEERATARADMANFPPFEGVVRHQAVELLEPSR